MLLVAPDDPILLRCAEIVEFPYRELSRIASGMLETMMTLQGCGLAAPQVGLPWRIIMFRHEGRIGTLVNPIIYHFAGPRIKTREGCLTFKDRVWECERSSEISIRYQNIQGKEFDEDVDGFLAVILQHETDHLDGVLISQHGKEITRDD